MRIAIEGCLHGELQKVYETLEEIEQREKYKIDLLLCCGDFQATRNLPDLKCMAVPDKYKEMGTFYKYYSGELKAPVLTLVIGGNHEASNHFQELPFGGWLCPNIYFMGNCGVVNLADDSGVILSIGGLSGIYKANDYLRGRHERPPYTESSKRSVYHVRNIDTFRLKSMDPESVDLMMSHDWPRGITDYGNVDQLLRRKPFFREDIQRNELGSMPAMDILQYLMPKYWFSGHLHVKFAAIFEGKTKFLALDKCLPQRRFLQVIQEGPEIKGNLKLQYHPKWLAILKSTNHLQSSNSNAQHMPGPGYESRFDFKPTEEEIKVIQDLFNGDFDIPLNFKTTVKVFDPQNENVKQMFSVGNPEAQVNPQTEEFCEKLAIDDPISLIDQETSIGNSSAITASDLTFEVTKNDDEIELDDSDEDEKVEEVKTSSRSILSLPPPKNDETEVKEEDPIIPAEIEAPPSEKSKEEKSNSPQKKVLKRRNMAIYASNDDE